MRKRPNRIARPFLRRARHWWRAYQWLVIALFALITAALVFVGIERPGESLLTRVLKTLSVLGFANKSLTPYEAITARIAGWLFVGVALFTVFKVWRVVFRDQFDILRMRRLTNHAVVCGAGDKGTLLASALREAGIRVVIVDAHLVSGLVQCRNEGLLTVVGDARDPDLLRIVGVDRCRFLIATCQADETNAEIAEMARTLCDNEGRGRARILVHISDLPLYHALHRVELEVATNARASIQYFNVDERGARGLLDDFPSLRIDRQGRAPTRILILGFDRFGQSLLLRLARDHLLDSHDPSEALQVRVVDFTGQGSIDSLKVSFPRVVDACRIEFLTGISESGVGIDRALRDTDGSTWPEVVVVCPSNDSEAMICGLRVRDELAGSRVPILVRVVREGGVASLLHRSGTEGAENPLETFCLLRKACTLPLLFNGTSEILAEALHANYLRDELAQGVTWNSRPAMRSWDDLDEDLRESNRRLAEHIPTRLSAIGCRLAASASSGESAFEFSPNEVEELAQMEHA